MSSKYCMAPIIKLSVSIIYKTCLCAILSTKMCIYNENIHFLIYSCISKSTSNS